MALGADDGEAAGVFDFVGEFDVGASAGHVGGYGHGAFASGLGHDVGLLLVELGVEDVVGNVAQRELAAEVFGDFNRCGADQNGASGGHEFFDFLDDGCIFRFFGAIYAVVHVKARYGAVGGYADHVELVDIPELACFCFGRTGHAGQLVIHSEVVLQRNGGESLGCGFDFHTLFGLECLVKSVGVAAALHDAAGLLVDNFDFVVVNNVFLIFVEEGVGFEQLVDRVDALGLDGIVLKNAVFFFGALCKVGNRLKGAELRRDVGENEERGVGDVAGQHVIALVSEVDLAVLFVDFIVEGFYGLGHFAAVVLNVVALGFEQQRLHAVLAQEFDQGLIFRAGEICAVEGQGAFATGFGIVGRNFFASLAHQTDLELALCVDHVLDVVFVFVEVLVVALGHGTGYNQRRAGVVNKHRVDLVDNGIVVFALHHVVRAHCHVVAQVVEAEFVVGAEGDVAVICGAALVGVGLVLVDAVDSRAVEHVERAHPFAVALGEVVVDGNYVDAASAERAEEHGECGHEGFALTGSHFGDFALVEHYAANQLHVIVDHIPLDFIAASEPVVLVDCMAVVGDADKVASLSGQVAVELGGRYGHVAFGKACGGFAQGRKHDGQVLVEFLFDCVEALLFVFVDFVPEGLALVKGEGFDALAKLFDGGFVRLDSRTDVGAHFIDALAQTVGGEALHFRSEGVYLFDYRLNLAQVALRFVAEELAEK